MFAEQHPAYLMFALAMVACSSSASADVKDELARNRTAIDELSRRIAVLQHEVAAQVVARL